MASKCDEEKNSFTNQVLKDKMVFPLFLVKSNGLNLSARFSMLFFSPVKKLGYKKGDHSQCIHTGRCCRCTVVQYEVSIFLQELIFFKSTNKKSKFTKRYHRSKLVYNVFKNVIDFFKLTHSHMMHKNYFLPCKIEIFSIKRIF